MDVRMEHLLYECALLTITHMLILLPPSDLAKGLAYEKFLINIHSVVEKWHQAPCDVLSFSFTFLLQPTSLARPICNAVDVGESICRN